MRTGEPIRQLDETEHRYQCVSPATRVLRVALASLVIGVAGCGAPAGRGPREPSAEPSPANEAPPPVVEIEPDVEFYSTEPKFGGARDSGAAADARSLVLRTLEARRDHPELDGALAATASWVLHEAYAKKNVFDAKVVADVSRRFGYAGLVLGTYGGSMGQSAARRTIETMIAAVPAGFPVNRYAVVAGVGPDVVVIIGSIEASLKSFPRAVAPGGTAHLEGSVSQRFRLASVVVTSPDGKVESMPMRQTSIDAVLRFPKTGIYMVEIMGDGPSGPVVVMDVPVRGGVAESHDGAEAAEADPNLTDQEAEEIMLELLNEERRNAGIGEVVADSQLQNVALSHSADMAAHHFFGHVSPTTGTPEDRARRANVHFAKLGECVVLELTPARAHRSLLQSPAHRSGMLDPAFTRVGIGIQFSDEAVGQRRIYGTLLFTLPPPR